MFDPPGRSDDQRPPTPPSPDDRLWRHPSEVAAQARSAAAAGPPSPSVAPDARHPRGQRFSLGTVVVAGSLGAFAMFASLVALGMVTGMPADDDAGGVTAATSPQALRTSTAAAPDGVVALRVATTVGVTYGVGLVVDREGDVVTTLGIEPGAAATVTVGHDAATWSPATVVATDRSTGLTVVRSGAASSLDPAEVARPQLSEEVRMVRPGAGSAAVLAGIGTTRISGTNASLRTSAVDCVGLSTLTSPRRTGPSEVAVSTDGVVVGLVVPEDDDPEDEVAYVMGADVAVDVAHQLLSAGRVLQSGLDATLARDGARLTVTGIASDGLAADAGLRVGDELLTVEGRRVHSADDVAGAVLGRTPGDLVVVVVRRGQRQSTLRIPLTDATPAATPVATDVATVSTTVVG